MKTQRNNQMTHQLLLNYNPPSNNNTYYHFPTTSWTQAWIYIETNTFNYLTESQNTFPYNSILNKLRRTVLTHNTIDNIYSEVRKEVTRIFYRVFNHFVRHLSGKQLQQDEQMHQASQKNNQQANKQYLQSYLRNYKLLKPKLHRFLSALTIALSKYTTYKQLQKQMHGIQSKQMMNSPFYQQFVNQCLQMIDNCRDQNLEISSSNNKMQQQQQQPLKIIALLVETKTFPYIQYIERSKKYYGQLLHRIPKKLQMFHMISQYIKMQKNMQQLINIDYEKYHMKQVGMQNGGYQMLDQQETIQQILCKEVLMELYPDMIEYLDYLLEKNGNQNNMKTTILKQLWNFTTILNKYSKQNTTSLLLNRFSEIIKDSSRYINSKLYKLIIFKQHLHQIVSQCFSEDTQFINEINNGIEYVLMENQMDFNSILCSIILNANYQWPTKQLMREQSKQGEKQENISNRLSTELFKLTPSKQNFIRKFQQEFSRFVLAKAPPSLSIQETTDENQNRSLQEQSFFIKQMQLECGYMLTKNIQKMISDVWKSNKFIYCDIGVMRCRVLSPDWPQFICKDCKLVDELQEIREQFQNKYRLLGDGENEKKNFKWIWQCGTIVMEVMGVSSVFSEVQASIVILLNRSFRPMKKQQFAQILEYPANQVQLILKQLVDNQVIVMEQQTKSCELNFDNKVSYNYKLHQESVSNKQKKSMQRDYGIIIEAYITRILKKRKSLQKTDLHRLLSVQLKTYLPSLEQIGVALEKLCARDIVTMQKTRGIIRYIQ